MSRMYSLLSNFRLGTSWTTSKGRKLRRSKTYDRVAGKSWISSSKETVFFQNAWNKWWKPQIKHQSPQNKGLEEDRVGKN